MDDFIGRTLKKGKTFDSVNAASKIDTSRPVYGATAVAGLAAYSSHRNNNDVRKNDEKYNKKYGKKVRK